MKKKIFKSILFLLLFQGFFAWSGFTQDTQSEYDPMYTVHALNACVFSISNILRFEDRIVLDEEYKNIINNLKLGNIYPDDELRSLYSELMDYITDKKLNDIEQSRVKAIFERTSKRAAWEAVGGIRAYGANPISFFLSFVQSAGSAYFQYHNLKSQMQQELDESLWQLERADITELNRLRKELLNTAWVLHGKYKFPDQHRLTEELINNYFDAIYDSDLARAQRKLSRLESHFDNFPPFWYHFGRIAQQNNKNDFALQCYDKFEKSYREIYRKDPLYAQLCLNKLHILGVADGLKRNTRIFFGLLGSKSSSLDKSIVINYLKTAEKHSRFEEGYNYLRMAIFYQAIGELSEAQRCLQINIDNHVEFDISYRALKNLENQKHIFDKVPELLNLLINYNEDKIIDDNEVVSVKKIADDGDAVAQYQYARYLLYNKSKSEESLVYFLKAADQGHAPSMYEAATHPSLASDKSIAYLKNSADLMYPPALYVLGSNYYFGYWEMPVDRKRGLELIESAAKLEIPDAQYQLFNIYYEENPDIAATWFNRCLRHAVSDKWIYLSNKFYAALVLKNNDKFLNKTLAKSMFEDIEKSKGFWGIRALVQKFFIDHAYNSRFHIFPHIDKQQKKNAIAAYANPNVKPDDIIILFDWTIISENADRGFFISSDALYSEWIAKDGIKFESISQVEHNNGEILVNGKIFSIVPSGMKGNDLVELINQLKSFK
ncbi:MAG TPA: tetratricopeptide repeat protein [bacterium]|nr:tetratricopeptide repeat protein [bacterium]